MPGTSSSALVPAFSVPVGFSPGPGMDAKYGSSLASVWVMSVGTAGTGGLTAAGAVAGGWNLVGNVAGGRPGPAAMDGAVVGSAGLADCMQPPTTKPTRPMAKAVAAARVAFV